ncbi:MAG TPA: NahK/ErcS family hybrid sensor histidine kinase/response regulator, partial [Solimonas sp.]|nr:NahK/ErcS family hybrid sensor histidine kinase/response regulator [Solimonas sp.]
VGGLYWRRGAYPGAVAGICIGFGLWLYTLLLPILLPSGWLEHGPLGIAALRPQALFGLTGLDPVTHSTLWSLAGNLLAYVGVSLLAKPGLHERLQAARFLGLDPAGTAAPGAAPNLVATVGDLQELLERFFGAVRAGEIVAELAQESGRPTPASKDRADPALIRQTEHLLAGALGTASARLVLASALRGRDMQLEDVIRLLDETSHVIQFNRELLRAALEHLSQGVSVVDRELRLVAWNRRYAELFAYPPALVSVGRPIEELFRYNAGRGLLGPGAADELVARRLEHLRRGNPYRHEREFPDGTVVEISGTPMPGGGFVTSYADVTAYKRTERALQESNETLETRVAERTRELTQAKAEAERANDAKTRFLAAASHDLVQPLNAARLFVSALDPATLAAPAQAIVSQVESSLTSAETLISSLLDISRLDARAQEMRLEHFALRDILQPLAAEFGALARERGLALRHVPSSAVVHSDPMLLRRVLQNFLSNAVRYTRSGTVLLGCRRLAGSVRIEVWDTGPGIPEDSRELIFEEFRRLAPDDAGERGLGLGLAIAERIARVLGHALSLRSEPGRGSVFAIEVPLGERGLLKAPRAPRSAGTDRVAGARVLCLENEPAVLAGMRSMLESWQCRVIAVRSAAEAQAHFRGTGEIPDLALVDYHLDQGENGVRAAAALAALWGVTVPAIVITADHTQAAKAAAAEHGYALLPKPVKPAALRSLMSRVLLQRNLSPPPLAGEG